MKALLVCAMFLVAGALAVGVAKRATVVHDFRAGDAERFFASVIADAGLTYFQEGGECSTPGDFANRCNKLEHGQTDWVVVIGGDQCQKWFDYATQDQSLTDARFIADGGLFNIGAYAGTLGVVTVESNIGYDEYGCIWIGQAGLVLPIRAGE